MAGLFVFAVLGLYIWFANKALRGVASKRGKAVVILIFVLIPTADAIYGRVKLQHLCRSDGGVKVYKVVENVDGLYDEMGRREFWVKVFGFKFAETWAGDGLVDRLSRQPDGALVEEKKVQSESIYRFRYVRGSLKDVYMRDAYVVDTRDGSTILGEIVSYNFAGGWAERAIAALVAQRGSADHCPSSATLSELQNQLVMATLKPSKISSRESMQ